MKIFERKFRVRVKLNRNKNYIIQYSEFSILGVPFWNTLIGWLDWGHPDSKHPLKRAGFRVVQFTDQLAEEVAAKIKSIHHVNLFYNAQFLKAKEWKEEEQKLQDEIRPYKIKNIIP